LQKSLPCANAQATLCGWTHTYILDDREEGQTYNRGICKSWADGSRVSTFVFQFSFISGRTLIIKLCAYHQLLFINLASGSRADGRLFTSLRKYLLVVGYAKRNLVQFQTVTDRKLFGTNTLVDDFTKNLTQVETLDGGWATKYIDNSTGHQWLKYVVDDRNFFVNLILISPPLTTDQLIEIALNTNYVDEISAAATRLNFEEQSDKKEYRQKLIDRLNLIDISKIDTAEKERIKTIILAAQLTDRVNRRGIVGKHFSEIQIDANFFNVIADIAENILKLL
jgi:hypothetical protein